jgi:hypothetical protein
MPISLLELELQQFRSTHCILLIAKTLRESKVTNEGDCETEGQAQ